jgi:hypothetical protein
VVVAVEGCGRPPPDVPESAELVARIAGTRETWIHTQRIHGTTLGDAGTRTPATNT